MGYRGVLHTNTKYADFSFELPNVKDASVITTQIRRLQGLEENFYSSFFPGCKTIGDFIRKLNEELKNFNQDKLAFRFFQNASVRSALTKKFGTTTSEQAEITITFVSKNADFNVEQWLNIKGATVSGDKISLGANVPAFKEAFNKFFDRRFQSMASSKRALNDFIKMIQGKSSEEVLELLTPDLRDEALFFGVEGNANQTTTVQRKLNVGSFFSYTAEDIRAAQQDDAKELREEIEQAKVQILNFLLDEARSRNASEDMLQAIRLTWAVNFEGELSQIAFWEKGGVLTSLVGAFGEFQAALLENYIKVALQDSNLPPAIISETINQSEQAKVDVTFLDKIGVQVKNYNPFTTGQNSDLLKGNLHPNKLIQFPDFKVDVTSFFDFLTNYFFNLTYQEEHKSAMADLETRLNSYFAEIMNFDVGLQVGDTVVFYFIEGQYLVPGSQILESAYLDQLNRESVKITSEYRGKTDEEYSPQQGVRHRSNQIFLEWWRASSNFYHFTPTAENYSLYNSLISSKISIRTGFHYRGVFNTAQYALF